MAMVGLKLSLATWNLIKLYIQQYPVAGLATVFLSGVLAWGSFNWSLEITNTEKFCISCHEMRENVFKEYQTSIHYSNMTGVRASCPDCHVPRTSIFKIARKVRATNELYHWAIGSIDTKEKFQARRYYLAKKVWSIMESNNSQECRNCHDIDSMDTAEQPDKPRLFHELSVVWDMTCIDCHKGIAHSLPKEFDVELVMDKLHDRMEKEEVTCQSCHAKLVSAPPGDGWDDK